MVGRGTWIGQSKHELVHIEGCSCSLTDKKWFYKVSSSQNLIMPNWKSEALACHLLRTAIMFFLYKRAIIGIEYPELHIFHFRVNMDFAFFAIAFNLKKMVAKSA